ncbi:MAG: hypothetical protein IJ808_09345 [Muribaculaceae bacterium]|nr:hypothetical protein [Muribaculaceae bacterium]
MKTIYECSQSKGIKWFTAIFFLVVIFAILLEIYYVSKGANLTSAIAVTAILLVASISSFLVFPIYITSDDEGTGIKTLLHTVKVPFEYIDHIERVDEQKRLFGATNTIRLFGVGGVFGYDYFLHENHSITC